MSEAARKSNHVDNTSENELQAHSNLSHESSSDDKVVLQSPTFKAFNKPNTSNALNVYGIIYQKWTGL